MTSGGDPEETSAGDMGDGTGGAGGATGVTGRDTGSTGGVTGSAGSAGETVAVESVVLSSEVDGGGDGAKTSGYEKQ